MGKKGKYRQNPLWWKVLIAYGIDLSFFPVGFCITSSIVCNTPWFFFASWFFTALVLARCEGKMHKDSIAKDCLVGFVGKSLMHLRVTTVSAEKLFFVYLLDLFPIVILGICQFMGTMNFWQNFALAILVPPLYFTLTEGRTGQSWGKKLFRIRAYQEK
ncbi:MAG: hypothetical protein IKP96_04180 [Elusimicrobiaceae bacterium]|nr:hypothetical protein [Elusimicrobiaceae bacterium]